MLANLRFYLGWWLGVGLLSLGLAACAPSKVIIPLTVFPSPTFTISPTPTVPPTRTPYPTVRPTATFIATFMPSRYRTSTPTVSPTPQPLPTLAPLVAADYNLQPPDPQQLLTVIDLAAQAELTMYFGHSQGNEYLDRTLNAEGTALQRWVAADLRRHYPAGLPIAAQALQHLRPWNSYFSSEAVNLISQAGVLQLLNANPPLTLTQVKQLTPGVFLQSQAIELNGVAPSEWLVQLTIGAYGVNTWLLLEQTSTGHYRLVPNDLQDIWVAIDTVTTDLTHDLTGDGQPEVIIHSTGYALRAYHSWFDVYTWRAGRLAFLTHLDLTTSDYEAAWPEPELLDANADGITEVRVTLQRSGGVGCRWQQVTTYRFNHAQPQTTTTGLTAPNTPLCEIGVALNQLPKQTTRLANALARLQPADAPSPDYLAWVQLRLAVAYAQRGQTAAVNRTLQTLMAEPAQAGFALAVQQTYTQTGGDIVQLCDVLHRQASDPKETGLGTAIYSWAAYSAWLIPEQVCPLNELVNSRLAQLNAPATQPITTALQNIGLPLSLSVPLRLTEAEVADTWLGIVALQNPMAISYTVQSGRWHAAVLTYLSGPVSGLQGVGRDVVGGKGLELLVVGQSTHLLPTEAPAWCNQQPMLLWLFIPTPEGYTWKNTQRTCTAASTLDAFLAQTTGAQLRTLFATSTQGAQQLPLGYEWWQLPPALRGLCTYNCSTLEAIAKLEARILAGAALTETQPLITMFVNHIPNDNAAGQHLRARLTYLRGIAYELHGQSAQAIDVYRQLLAQAPASPWSWLASARLKPLALDVMR